MFCLLIVEQVAVQLKVAQMHSGRHATCQVSDNNAEAAEGVGCSMAGDEPRSKLTRQLKATLPLHPLQIRPGDFIIGGLQRLIPMSAYTGLTRVPVCGASC